MHHRSPTSSNRSGAKRRAVAAHSHHVRLGAPWRKRLRSLGDSGLRNFMPPETWYEPADQPSDTFTIVEQQPGEGYRHVVNTDDIRERLAEFPAELLAPLEVVQLSRMTRKKSAFPMYGMQWGPAIYLYPIETSLVEHFARPPKPAQLNETRMYGGRWEPAGGRSWRLVWSEAAIRDFYLNNILIHELGHLLDQRNTRPADRERFAEWFAIEYGYKASRRRQLAADAVQKLVRRRHHAR